VTDINTTSGWEAEVEELETRRQLVRRRDDDERVRAHRAQGKLPRVSALTDCWMPTASRRSAQSLARPSTRMGVSSAINQRAM